jgi:hypothetical protein
MVLNNHDRKRSRHNNNQQWCEAIMTIKEISTSTTSNGIGQSQPQRKLEQKQ